MQNCFSYDAYLLKSIMYVSGDSVLHLATRAENETAAIFLATNGAKSSLANLKVDLTLVPQIFAN